MSPLSASKAKEFIDAMFAEIASQRPAILRFMLLSVVILAPYMIWFPQDGKIELRGAYLALAIAMGVLAIASRLLFALVCLLLIAPALFHQHLGRHWDVGQLDARVEVYFESPPGEIREYIRSHIDAIDIAFLVGAALYVFVLIRWTTQNKNASGSMKGLAAAALVVGVVVFVGLGLDRRLRHFVPYNMVVQTVKAKERYNQLAQRNDYLQQSPLASENCDLRYEKIVIVLGESAISDHLSVFGYTKPTTPFAERSNPYAFDAIAPSNQTRYSLGMMLTEAELGSFDVFYEAHSLVGQLRSCGYDTMWISNQGRRGEFDSFATSMAREANEQVFLNDWSWTSTKLDGQMVKYLDARGVHERTRHATFVHLIGSHTDYSERFPVGFGFPGVADVVSTYDNSILYTDHVLSELHDLFAGDSVLFVYVSDHGQLVSESKFGSGFSPAYKEEYRTPLLIWTEDSDAIESIRQAIGDSKLNLESFDDVVRFLIGMTSTLKVSTRQSVSMLTPENTQDYRELATLGDDRQVK